MSKIEYEVFCADCKNQYTQSGYKPTRCGACGSNWIAVKNLTKERYHNALRLIMNDALAAEEHFSLDELEAYANAQKQNM